MDNVIPKGYILEINRKAIIDIGFGDLQWADMIKLVLILNDGFLNYGDMSGEDMEAINVDFKMVMNEKVFRT